MALPRFLFVVGAATLARRWVPEASVGVPVQPAGPGDLSSWVGWRLTGGNNHELGRSATLYADLAAARRAVRQLQEAAPQLEPVVGVESLTGLWRWQVELAGQPVAVCGRPYYRQRECLYNVQQFLAALPVAVTAPKVVFLSRGGRHQQPSDGPEEAGRAAEDPFTLAIFRRSADQGR